MCGGVVWFFSIITGFLKGPRFSDFRCIFENTVQMHLFTANVLINMGILFIQ